MILFQKFIALYYIDRKEKAFILLIIYQRINIIISKIVRVIQTKHRKAQKNMQIPAHFGKTFSDSVDYCLENLTIPYCGKQRKLVLFHRLTPSKHLSLSNIFFLLYSFFFLFVKCFFTYLTPCAFRPDIV